jgi:hypothetical protein
VRRRSVHVQNDAPFNLTGDADESSDTRALIISFFHGDVRDFSGAAHRFRNHGVERINKRLDEFHFHDWMTPAVAGVSTALSFNT